MERDAQMSACGTYRYDLWRRWVPDGRVLLWILLNPSTADAVQDDPTIVRCIRFAARWGYGAIRVINLFALRATDPRELYAAADPVGPQNDAIAEKALPAADGVICAWGNHGQLNDRGARVQEMLSRHRCDPRILGVTRLGQPMHPLYIAYSAPRRSWDINARNLNNYRGRHVPGYR